jgi:hypothetical protein
MLLWREAVYYDATRTMSEVARIILQTNAEAPQAELCSRFRL